jgi:hypothetical protein
MVLVNVHQHQKGKLNLSKKIFGPEATLMLCLGRNFVQTTNFPAQFSGLKWAGGPFCRPQGPFLLCDVMQSISMYFNHRLEY